MVTIVWDGLVIVAMVEFVSNSIISHEFVIVVFGIAAGSSWYLLCENCREKYVKNSIGNKQPSGKFAAGAQKKAAFIKPPVSPSASSDHDVHLIMKNNAVFLLELASSSDSGAFRTHTLKMDWQ